MRVRRRLFWVKLLHTLVFLVESAAILYILYSGVTGTFTPWLGVAVGLVIAEVIVYVANGLRCPMTNWALALGDESGNDFVADIFLPRTMARLIPPVCGTLAVIGSGLVFWRLFIR